MSKFNNKREMAIGIMITVIAAIMDILVSFRIIPHIIVNENYIFYVFSALCTVGTLGSVFISIVVSVFSNKCLGFSIKEIINFPASGIEVGNITGVSLAAIAIAIPFLAADYTNTISALASYVVIFILFKIKKLWKIISNDDNLKSIVYSEIERQAEHVDEEIIIDWLNIWFYELKSAIESRKEKEQSEYLKLISNTTKKCNVMKKKNAYARLESWVGEIFRFSNIKIGFVEAYQKIILLGEFNSNDIHFDVRTIVGRSIEYLRYSEEKIISQINIQGNIDHIIWDLEVDKEMKIYIIYQYYSAIFRNLVIHNDYKFFLLSLYFKEVCNFKSRENIDEILSQVILYIFKNDVLLNEDIESREKLYLLILKQLFINNRYSNDFLFISTISKIYRAIYFYAFLETETISKEFRNGLGKMIGLRIESMDNVLISLPRMIDENSDCIIEALIADAVDDENSFDMFNYFPEGFGAKYSVWTIDTKIQFVFWIYCIFGYRFSLFPAKKYFDDENISLWTKKIICTTILNMFKAGDESLDRRTMENIQNLRLSLKVDHILPDGYFKENFKFFNDQLKVINGKDHQLITPTFNLVEINEELKRLMEEHPLIEFLPELKINEGKEYQLLPEYIHISMDQTKVVARRIQYAVRDIVNQIIENVLPKVELEFNINGVNMLLKELKNKKILFRNYTFVDDWALDKKIRETEEYQELCQKIGSIEFKRTNQINHYVFLSIKGVKVNAEATSYKLDMLSDEQCDKYIENSKVADGRYKIDGVIYNKDEAIKVVKDTIRIESVVVKVKTNVSNNSGFRVTFK